MGHVGDELRRVPKKGVATLPCETLMSENERQSQTNAVINDKLPGMIVTYLRCGGIFNNQINKGLLLSLTVKHF